MTDEPDLERVVLVYRDGVAMASEVLHGADRCYAHRELDATGPCVYPWCDTCGCCDWECMCEDD